MANTAKAKPNNSMMALELARKATKSRVEVLNALKANEVSLEKALDNPAIGNVRIEMVLRALPCSKTRTTDRSNPISRRNAAAILARAGISPCKPVGSLRNIVTRGNLLNVAHSVSGRHAWIYESDSPPVLVERHTKGTKGRTEIQIRAAEKSLATRRRRREIKDQLRSGSMSLEEAITDPAAERWPIGEIVVNLRRFNPDGTVKTRAWSTQILRTLNRVGMPETAKAGQLTAYDRRMILLAFADEGFLAVKKGLVAA